MGKQTGAGLHPMFCPAETAAPFGLRLGQSKEPLLLPEVGRAVWEALHKAHFWCSAALAFVVTSDFLVGTALSASKPGSEVFPEQQESRPR